MKQRLDVYMAENNLAEGRTRAQALIMSGMVYVNEQKADKAGMQVSEKDKIEVREGLRYVSRGGLKLEKAMNSFGAELSGKVCMDIGASTGGFTDCMLQNGAKKVYSVDVGYGQLAWSLRQDERVVNMERTNIRFVEPQHLDELLDFASVDVSFISLKLIFPVMSKLLKKGGEAVCLIKPQFEAGKEKVGKNGVVREAETHKEVIENVMSYAEENRFSILGLDFSPIKGPKGNIEYLLYIRNDDSMSTNLLLMVNEIVKKAHEEAK